MHLKGTSNRLRKSHPIWRPNKLCQKNQAHPHHNLTSIHVTARYEEDYLLQNRQQNHRHLLLPRLRRSNEFANSFLNNGSKPTTGQRLTRNPWWEVPTLLLQLPINVSQKECRPGTPQTHRIFNRQRQMAGSEVRRRPRTVGELSCDRSLIYLPAGLCW